MDLKDCIPLQIYRENGCIIVKWLHMGEKRYGDPFFEDTVYRLKCSNPSKAVTESGEKELLILSLSRDL